MSLGNNRDYKTNARRVTKNLAAHFAIMTRLIAQGMDREAASEEAFRQIMQPKGKAKGESRA